MKLVTLRDGNRDGCLVVLSRDLTVAISARPHAATLRQAIEDWDQVAPVLADLYRLRNIPGVSGLAAFAARPVRNSRTPKS
ncbi:MAG: hypothetical protein ACN6O4_15295 [Pseudomonas sp.]